MKPRWRWAIAAGTVLLVAVLLHGRMNATHMRKVLPQLVSRLTHADIKFDRLSFSFVHGLDVRLDKVRIQHAAWGIQAPNVLLELRVIPLLLGSVELQGIYLRSPVIRFATQKEQETSTAEMHGLPRGMMLDQLSVSDATIINDAGQTLISGLDMDMHDIGPNRTMRWELQARTGEQMANGHGELGFRLATVYSGFAKLSLKRIPLQALHGIPRISALTGRLSHHGYHQLSTVITLSIAHGDQWTAFSEVTLSGDQGRPDIILRGKLYRDASHALAWKDAFIQVGNNALLAVEGGCDKREACTTAIRGKSVNLTPFLNMTAPGSPPWQPVSGNMDVQADLHWRRHDWRLSGQAEMQGITWKDATGTFGLPDFSINNVLVLGTKGNVRVKSALIGFAQHSGDLLAAAHYDAHARAGELNFRLNALQDAWAPALRLTSMIDPSGALPISGQGIMQGDIKLVIADGKPDLRFSLDGTKAEVHLAGGVKPAGLAAKASGDWQPGADDGHLMVNTATLGTSMLKGLVWRHSHTRRQLAIGNIQLDMQALRKQGVRFPDVFKPFQGAISGSLSTAWDAPVRIERLRGLWPGLPRLNAQLDLDRFGTDGWQLRGHVVFDRGSAVLKAVRLTGTHGSSAMDGEISFASGKGHIDFRRGALVWKSDDAVPAWLTSMHLRGRIRSLHMSWLGQKLEEIGGRYRLDGARLQFPALKAMIGDGNLSAHDITVDFKPGSLALRGDTQLGGLHVQKLAGLTDLLHGELTGKTFATVRFDGTLPFQHWQDWHGNGNIMIYGGHWRAQPQNGVTQSVHHFDLFGFRFRRLRNHTSLQNIQIENAGGRYSGTARMSAGGMLQGTLTRHEDGARIKIGGSWPDITWTQTPATAP